jgi:geranylgeranyl diphosphate synthase type I
VRATSAVPEVLLRSRHAVVPVLAAAIGRLTPELLAPAEYHLGWRDAEGRAIEAPGGKFVRASLAILSAESAGADPEVALPGAAAVELVHNFSLIHDDIVDGDRTRRHRPTVWSLFGVGTAIIVGDALLALANQLLLETPGPNARAASRTLLGATTSLIAGEAADISFERRASVPLDECISMSAGKTGALLSAAASVGAILAGADPDLIGALAAFGLHLGLAFQATDDLLGIWGDPEVTGKPRFSDLRQRKKSIPIAIALESGDQRTPELAALLAEPIGDEADLEATAALVELCGGRRETEVLAAEHLATAIGALDSVGIAGRAREELEELAHFVTSREF